MFSMGYSVCGFIIAAIIAFLEIQIEGENGWAKNLPCWRPKPELKIVKFYSWFQGGKEVTGYHLALNALEFTILHLPFFGGVPWGLIKEFQILSYLPLFWVFEDFLWFTWNPFYGLKKFNPQNIWWHRKWTGPIPTDYLIGAVFSGIFILFATILKNPKVFMWWVATLGILGTLTFISCVIQIIKSRV